MITLFLLMELNTRKLVSAAKARSFHQSIGLFNSNQSLDRVVLSLIDTLVSGLGVCFVFAKPGRIILIP